jgi:hypothetical protein
MNISEKIMTIYNSVPYAKQMHKASMPFLNQLTESEIKSCKMYAIWVALTRHKGKKAGMKFGTFLHRGVFFQCVTLARFNRKGSTFTLNEELTTVGSINNNELDVVDMEDEILALPDSKLVVERVHGYTISDMASKNNAHRKIISQKLAKSSRILRSRLDEGV